MKGTRKEKHEEGKGLKEVGGSLRQGRQGGRGRGRGRGPGGRILAVSTPGCCFRYCCASTPLTGGCDGSVYMTEANYGVVRHRKQNIMLMPAITLIYNLHDK